MRSKSHSQHVCLVCKLTRGLQKSIACAIVTQQCALHTHAHTCAMNTQSCMCVCVFVHACLTTRPWCPCIRARFFFQPTGIFIQWVSHTLTVSFRLHFHGTAHTKRCEAKRALLCRITVTCPAPVHKQIYTHTHARPSVHPSIHCCCLAVASHRLFVAWWWRRYCRRGRRRCRRHRCRRRRRRRRRRRCVSPLAYARTLRPLGTRCDDAVQVGRLYSLAAVRRH